MSMMTQKEKHTQIERNTQIVALYADKYTQKHKHTYTHTHTHTHTHTYTFTQLNHNNHISSVESQKGAIAVHMCSVENQKGTITIDFVQ